MSALGDGPAFPHPTVDLHGPGSGMTLRQYYAGLAMQAFIANYVAARDCYAQSPTVAAYYDAIAAEALIHADALLARLEAI